ncbi:MAG TPA: TetR/AcrR family transcriptional regulator [Acidimicrobiales bacterium]|nr:TetR/AcrR family transcriptional regulator [Acidimicrobiales bacterium]
MTPTRERVLRSARAAFASQGYAGASMRRIAADAGLTAMALYTYAPSKAELFRLVYEDGIARIYCSFAEVVIGRSSLVEEVDALLECGGEILDHDPDLLRFTIRHVVDREHDDIAGLDVLTEPYLVFFEDLARRAVGRGDIARADAVRLVEFVTMLLWGITTFAAIEPAKVRAAVDTAKWAAAGRLAR